MTVLDWQLTMGGQPIRGGRILTIEDRFCTADDVYLVLRDSELDIAGTFAVRFNVNIGGKDYLLMQEKDQPAEPLIPGRLLDKNRLSAMDPDRFSSLRNAMSTFIESNPRTAADDLSKVLGALPLRA